MNIKQQAIIAVPVVVILLNTIFGVVGYFIGEALGIPNRLALPVIVRIFGAVVLAFGFIGMGWLFRYRKPVEVLISTYETMQKAFRRKPPTNTSPRTEPLIVQGPQRYVRHPMYFAVVVLLFGWWLVLDYTFIVFMAFFAFLWFNLVVIRFEEYELRALFGKEYEIYAKRVPKFVPTLKSKI
jgi:protein-S-isoprenylcysteine O-methyltransferase Ste14